MTLCREWTLVNLQPEIRHARPLRCRSWNCDLCRPDRKAQLIAMAAAGSPTRFLTLTVNPKTGNDPADRLRLLSNAWRIIVKRIRREKGPQACEYLAVVEETKNGEPHLHILLRSPYISQQWLSKAMGELIDSPIVDIRRIRSQREVIAYVAKYISKAPAQFGGAKRYWHSKVWEAPADSNHEVYEPVGAGWKVQRDPLHSILAIWISEGWSPKRDGPDAVVALKDRWYGW